MKKITTFTPAVCRDLSEQIAAKLSELGDELGVSFTLRGGSYTATSYTPKIEVAIVAADGTVGSREADAFKLFAAMYGLSPNDLGRTFRSGSHEYKITGWRQRAATRPVLATRDGKEYAFPVDAIKMALAREAKG